jgi:hypothetical protein
MGWRFRKSFKVMPGVRLNLSKRGLSATIGASPLSVGIGQAGVYANASIPGTGLSYRQRLDMPQGPPPPLPPGEPPYAPTEQPPSSPPRMERMTSESLSELRKIMTETYLEKCRIDDEIEAAQGELTAATEHFNVWNQGFLMKRVNPGKFKKRLEKMETAQAQLEELKEQFRLISEPIVIDIDVVQAQLYCRLLEQFHALSGCKCIWDVTSEAATNRMATRSSASTSVERERVTFSLSKCKLVALDQEVPRLMNRNGGDMYFFPGFILCGDSRDDFAMIDYCDAALDQQLVHFCESEVVPADSKVVGRTWKMVNKDGSPDLRFRGNVEIPIVEYAEIRVTSITGLSETYLCSNAELAQRFVRAWMELRRSYE